MQKQRQDKSFCENVEPCVQQYVGYAGVMLGCYGNCATGCNGCHDSSKWVWWEVTRSFRLTSCGAGLQMAVCVLCECVCLCMCAQMAQL